MVPDQRGPHVQSLDRGLQLMEILSQADEPSGLGELSDLLSVDRSTVHRLLATLMHRGYVQQDPDSKRYTLGLKVVELSRLAIDRVSLRAVAKPHLKQLVRQTGESVNLAVMASLHCICLDHEPSPSALAVTNDIGGVFAPHATAAGKVLLASLPEERQQQVLLSEPLVGFTPRTITDVSALQRHLQIVRQQGYAVDDEERYLGVRCLAAPIYDHRGKVVAAVSVAGPATRVRLGSVPALAELVVSAAQGVSHEIGYMS
jgi:DNA-binding IclR family transcriptional regulator